MFVHYKIFHVSTFQHYIYIFLRHSSSQTSPVPLTYPASVCSQTRGSRSSAAWFPGCISSGLGLWSLPVLTDPWGSQRQVSLRCRCLRLMRHLKRIFMRSIITLPEFHLKTFCLEHAYTYFYFFCFIFSEQE